MFISMQKAASISCGVYPSLQPNIAVIKVTFWMKPLTGGSGVEQLMASSPLESERHSKEGLCRYIIIPSNKIMYTLNRTGVEIRIRIPGSQIIDACMHGDLSYNQLKNNSHAFNVVHINCAGSIDHLPR